MKKLKKILRLDKLPPVVYLLFIIFIIKFVILLSFNNTDWEPDGFQHFNQLNTVYSDFPNNLGIGLMVWAKPLFTFVYGLPVSIPILKTLLTVQVINVLVVLLISYIIYRLVLDITKNKLLGILSIVLVNFSFTLFVSSLSALTEPLFSLMLILGVYNSYKKQFIFSSLFFGLSVLARIEGLFFVGIYFIYLLVELNNSHEQLKRFNFSIRNFLILSIPTIIWNFLGYITTGEILYIFQSGYPSGGAPYGTGSILWYPKQFLLTETIISILFALSLFVFIRKMKSMKDKLFYIFLYVSSIGFILSQVITWRFGLFGSAGLMRYFVSVIPIMILILIILLAQIKSFRKKSVIFTLSFLQILIVVLNAFVIGKTTNWPTKRENYNQAGEWIKENIKIDEYVGTDNVEIMYYSGRNITQIDEIYGKELKENTKGYYVWSEEYHPSTSLEYLSSKAELIKSFDNKVMIFQIK